MNRILSIFVLISLFCSLSAANTGVRLFCSHEDGFGHVVDFETHEKETHADCDHGEASPSNEILTLEHEETSCEDIEVQDTELEDLSSSSDRTSLKAPLISLSLFAFSNRERMASREDNAKPPAMPDLRESESRRFAKIVQIRC